MINNDGETPIYLIFLVILCHERLCQGVSKTFNDLESEIEYIILILFEHKRICLFY